VFGTPSPNPSASSAEARPTATARPTRRQATPEPARTYVVRRGDTLRGIAARVYGDESLWRRIYRANRDRLRTPGALRIGMELRIPPLR
jgi:nucleoid-associated protein YgaU